MVQGLESGLQGQGSGVLGCVVPEDFYLSWGWSQFTVPAKKGA